MYVMISWHYSFASFNEMAEFLLFSIGQAIANVNILNAEHDLTQTARSLSCLFHTMSTNLRARITTKLPFCRRR